MLLLHELPFLEFVDLTLLHVISIDTNNSLAEASTSILLSKLREHRTWVMDSNKYHTRGGGTNSRLYSQNETNSIPSNSIRLFFFIPRYWRGGVFAFLSEKNSLSVKQ